MLCGSIHLTGWWPTTTIERWDQNCSPFLACCVAKTALKCSVAIILFLLRKTVLLSLKKVKVAHPITDRRVPELSRFLAVSLQVTWVINPSVGCHYFPGLQLPSQPLRWLLPVSLLGGQRHDGCEQFAWDCYSTASRLRFEPRPFCAWVQHANHSATWVQRLDNGST